MTGILLTVFYRQKVRVPTLNHPIMREPGWKFYHNLMTFYAGVPILKRDDACRFEKMGPYVWFQMDSKLFRFADGPVANSS